MIRGSEAATKKRPSCFGEESENSMTTSRRRLNPKPPAAKCKGCGHEKAIPGRADGFGKSCAHYRDMGVKQIEGAKAGR